ncbi:MAG: ATP-binding protein [Parvularculaceae bacterium]
MTREDFSAPTKRAIAMRSGYRCAHPECEGRTTIGPAVDADKSENTGKASHIFSASDRGPRGQGNLSPEDLRSVANGLWLCAKHADQVDLNDGKDYPPPVLLGWKAVHEFKIAREHGAMLNPFGWIESLKIVDAPIFKPAQQISFANANVLVGGNGVGKTTLCEWLSCLAGSAALSRWGAYSEDNARHSDIEVEFEIRAPTRQRAVLKVISGKPSITLDGKAFPFSPIGYEVVTLLSAREVQASWEEGDHIYIAKRLNIDAIEAQALTDFIASDQGVFLKGAAWEDVQDEDAEKPVRQLRCNLMKNFTQLFRTLSGGETGAVLLDLAVARATILSTYRPTLLIVETSAISMDPVFLSQFLEALSSPLVPFQSIFVTTELDEEAAWGGWQIIRLDRQNSEGTEIALG